MVKTLIFQNNFITVNDNKIITTMATKLQLLIDSHYFFLDSFHFTNNLRNKNNN